MFHVFTIADPIPVKGLSRNASQEDVPFIQAETHSSKMEKAQAYENASETAGAGIRNEKSLPISQKACFLTGAKKRPLKEFN